MSLIILQSLINTMRRHNLELSIKDIVEMSRMNQAMLWDFMFLNWLLFHLGVISSHYPITRLTISETPTKVMMSTINHPKTA